LFISKQAERVLGYPVERWLSEPTFGRTTFIQKIESGSAVLAKTQQLRNATTNLNTA